METGIRKTLGGYQVWFKTDNQTFHLDEHVEDTDKDSLEVAKFFERMLKVAFEKLDIHVVSNNEVALKAFVEEYVEAFEDGQGSDTALYRKAKSLL